MASEVIAILSFLCGVIFTIIALAIYIGITVHHDEEIERRQRDRRNLKAEILQEIRKEIAFTEMIEKKKKDPDHVVKEA